MERTESSTCRGCGKQIVWLKTLNDKNMPIDVETYETGDRTFDRDRHTSHFETCPSAAQFRRKKVTA